MNKAKKYERIYNQIEELISKTSDSISRMATISAILHHKFPYFFWTGFYRIIDNELIVGPYQGGVACLLLKQNTGICWSGINQKKSLVVNDVSKFKDHIACDSRSKSEIVVPIKNSEGKIIAILDVDSSELNSFDDIDKVGLEKIVSLIF